MTVMVEVLESSIVIPSEETPKNSLWLSNLDLNLAVAHSTPTIYVYRSNGDPDFFSVGRLKAALSKALVPYYPLAGRLGFDHDGRIQIECTGDGVPFVEARCKCTIDEFGNFMAPSSEMRQMLVPPMDSTEPPCGLLVMQVTFFSCGGVTLGIAANHRPCDGHGYTDFISLWSQFARGSITAPAVLPILDRSALRARTPPKVSFDHNPEYKPNTLTSTIRPAPPFSATLLKLSRDDVALIKGKNRFSTFQALVGHAWRSICIARDLSPEQETRLYFIVNVRGRMSPPLPRELFANVRCTTSAVALVGNITTSAPTEYVAAQKIQEAVATVSNEYVRSVIDFLEVDKNEGKWVLPSNDVIANTWVGMPIYDADFGWGKPEFMTRAVMRAPGFVHILPSPVNDQGRVYVMVGLEEKNVHKFNKVFHQGLNELRNKNSTS